MKKQNIEVEGGELLIQSKEGHYAVIPAKHRQEVMDMIKDGCDDCVNNYIQTLPKDSDYAQDGSLYPNLTGESKAQATKFSNEVIGAALPIPGLETMGKIPSVFKAGKNLIKPGIDKSATTLIKKGYKEIKVPQKQGGNINYISQFKNR